MAYGNYPTPSQTGVYIGEFHVDDAYGIEYSYTNSRSPMYSYFKEEVVNATLGKKIVTGVLSINWRYPGYLQYAIREAREKHINPADIKQVTRDGKSWVSQYLDEMRDGNTDDRMRLMLQAAALGPVAMNKMSALAYYSRLGNKSAGAGVASIFPSHTYSEDIFDVQHDHTHNVIPVDIWTHYGDIDEVHIAEVIQDVVFTGSRKQSQAGATTGGGMSSSGMNVIEVYSFWAKSVKQLRVDPQQINGAP